VQGSFREEAGERISEREIKKMGIKGGRVRQKRFKK
jgi:hypothetical protein